MAKKDGISSLVNSLRQNKAQASKHAASKHGFQMNALGLCGGMMYAGAISAKTYDRLTEWIRLKW